jgi:hypothetical protein
MKKVIVHVMIEEDGIVTANMSTEVSGGRHEFTFSQPIKANGRHFEGFALEMWLDQQARQVVYNEFIADRQSLQR